MKMLKYQIVMMASLGLGVTAVGGCSGGDANGIEAPGERAHNVRVLELAPSTLEGQSWSLDRCARCVVRTFPRRRTE